MSPSSKQTSDVHRPKPPISLADRESAPQIRTLDATSLDVIYFSPLVLV